MKRKNLERALAVSSVLVALGGCFGSPPETHYYSLRGGEKPGAAAARSPDAPVVLVDRFTIDESYADDRIAYRQGESHELGFDPYSRWAGSSAAQVEDAVRDLLGRAGIFSSVRQAQPIGEMRSGYDLVVTGRVMRLEEVDNDKTWEGVLDIELYLLDGKTRAVLQTVHLRDAETAASRNPRDVVAAIAHLLQRAVDELVKASAPIVAARKPAR